MTILIRAPDQISDRFYVISMEFLLLRHRRSSWQTSQVSPEGIKVRKQENQGSNYYMGLQCMMNKTVYLLTIKKHPSPPPQKKMQ